MAKSDPAARDHERIIELLPQADISSVEFLSGGLTNRNYRVATPGDYAGNRAVVVRLGVFDAPKLGIDRRQEQRLHERAATAGISPRPLSFDADNGNMVTPFIAGPLAVDILPRPTLEQLVALLQAVARLPDDDIAARDPRWQIGRYLAAAVDLGFKLPSAVERTHAIIDQLDWVATAVCHHDINPWNIVLEAPRKRPLVAEPSGRATSRPVTDERLWLLDWEYAALGDPAFDLATVAAWWQWTERQVAEAVSLLPDGAAIARRLPDNATLFHLREYAWAARQYALGRRENDILDQLQRELMWLEAQ